MKKSTKVIIVLLAVSLLGFIATFIFLSPKANSDAKTITVIVNHLDNSKKSFEIKTDSEYLRGALDSINLVSGEESSYGLWVQTVDGETADESAEQWWGYDINGELAMYGVDEQVINDGDVIEFTLNEGY